MEIVRILSLPGTTQPGKSNLGIFENAPEKPATNHPASNGLSGEKFLSSEGRAGTLLAMGAVGLKI